MFGMENVCFIPLTENTSSIFIHSSVIDIALLLLEVTQIKS